MPKNGTVETVRNRRDRSWGLKIAKNWLETIRKISGANYMENLRNYMENFRNCMENLTGYIGMH